VCTHGSLVEALLSALTSASDRGAFDQAWQRIAAHFDTLFTTETSIDQLRKTILQLAVMGKLVKQDPKDEPATELLKRIASERAKLVKQGRIKKQKPLMPVSDFEAPFDLPTGWEWSRIGEAALSTDYGLSDKTFEANHGVPVLAMGHIQSGEVLLGSHKRIPETVDSLPELYLDDRDLLYNRTNSADLVGKTGIFRGPSNQFTFASYLIRIRTLKDSALPEMINLNMLAPFFRLTQIDPNLKQQCGQANVNGTVMKNMLVAIPPAGEMSRIVAKVDELMSHCARLKESIQAAQTTQLLLADSLVNVAIH
jgi:type I restriction enzyme S subunit